MLINAHALLHMKSISFRYANKKLEELVGFVIFFYKEC